MRRVFRALLVVCVAGALLPAEAQDGSAPAPLRLAIAGLVHGHVAGFLRASRDRRDVQIVGVFDPDAALLQKYAQRSGLAGEVLFTDLAAMLDRARPEAIASFTNTYDHPAIVEAAAARHVAVIQPTVQNGNARATTGRMT